MTYSAKLIFFLLGIFLGINVIDASELQPLFKLFPGNRDVGGCDQDSRRLEAAYTEAIDMAQAAIEALKIVKGPTPYKDNDQTSLSDSERKQVVNWYRLARLAFVMFHIEVTNDGVSSGDSTDFLNSAMGQPIFNVSTVQY